jgi:hypothetical protein
MAKRDNHYEAAFEAYLRDRRLPYVAVHEGRRAIGEDGSIKSLDFIVSPRGARSWLVDVKGRRFPSGDESKTYWRNWSTRDDLRSLALWQEHFGPGFEPLLVFAFHLVADRSPVGPERLYHFRGGVYAFVGVRLVDYAAEARLLSPSWDTMYMPTAGFRSCAVPCDDLFEVPAQVA